MWEGDPSISASLEETGDITTASGVTTTPEPPTLTPSSDSEKNTDNTFHSFSTTVSQPCEQSCSTSSNNTEESDSACRFQVPQNQVAMFMIYTEDSSCMQILLTER